MTVPGKQLQQIARDLTASLRAAGPNAPVDAAPANSATD
jgi:hypothetical protein